MITQLLAHAGEVHETTAEAVQHTATDSNLLWIVLLFSPILIAFFSHIIFKLKLTTTLLTLAFFLISFSIYSYQSPGIYTAVSLIIGFTLVFVLTFIGLASKEH